MPSDRGDDQTGRAPNGVSGDKLSAEEKRLLEVWRDSLTLLDPRYHSKGLLQLAYNAMIDEKLRARLVNDTEAVLKELRAKLDAMPAGVSVRFHENSKDTLNVVLPPPAGEMAKRSKGLRDLLRSRTVAEFRIGRDDFDFGNFTDGGPVGHTDGGDGHTADPPIFR